MRVMVFYARGGYRCEEIENSLGALQNIVGGYIEPCAPVQLRRMGIELLANEEGLLAGLPLNQNLYPFFYVGNVVAVGTAGENFDELSDAQVDFLHKWVLEL